MSAVRTSVWAPTISVGAIILLAVATLSVEANARGMGGGAGGRGGASFGRGVGGAGFGHSIGHAGFGRGGPSFSHGIGRSAGVRSLSTPHVGRARVLD